MDTELKTPKEWEEFAGFRVHNRLNYELDGQIEDRLMSYKTFREITTNLTVMMTGNPNEW